MSCARSPQKRAASKEGTAIARTKLKPAVEAKKELHSAP